MLSSLYFGLILAPAGLGAAAATVQKGLGPEWVGCREVLQRRNPYRAEASREIEQQMFGPAPVGGADQHRFAYPVFFVFLFFPLALLPFVIAQRLALLTSIVLLVLSVRWWWHDGRAKDGVLLVITLLFASYPTVVALQLRQPTLLIAAVLAGVFCCARTHRLHLAGVLAALSTAKPQLAIGVLLPLLLWSMAEWRRRKAFLLAFGATEAALLVGSELLIPGWFGYWLDTIRAYAHYAGASPLVLELLPRRFYFASVALLAGSAIFVSYRFHQTDLLFAVSYSVTAFQLIFPFQIYNEILLLVPTIWIVKNAETLDACGQLQSLVKACAWILLASEWISQAGLSIADLLRPGSLRDLWTVPLVAAWLYPWTAFLTLALVVFSRWKATPHPISGSDQ